MVEPHLPSERAAEGLASPTLGRILVVILSDGAQMWHDHAMARIRVSTTVDQGLLEEARRARVGVNDARLLDEALTALLQKHRRAEIDAAYAAYDEHPLSAPDAWGDLESWREAAGRP